MYLDTIRRNNLSIANMILQETQMTEIPESSRGLLVAIIKDMKDHYKTEATVKEPCDFLWDLATYLSGSHDCYLAEVGFLLGYIVHREYDVA